MFEVKWELEDLCLLYLDEKYYDIVRKVDKRRSEREDDINRIIEKSKKKLQENNVEYVDVYGRAKKSILHLQKITNIKQFDELLTMLLVESRIIVKELPMCYVALELCRSLNHMRNRFKDYISTPKSNGYQSIHTTVTGEGNAPFEIQIRTEQMHEVAERGYAAHFNYKHADQKGSMLEDRLSGDIGKILDSEDEISSSEAF